MRPAGDCGPHVGGGGLGARVAAGVATRDPSASRSCRPCGPYHRCHGATAVNDAPAGRETGCDRSSRRYRWRRTSRGRGSRPSPKRVLLRGRPYFRRRPRSGPRCKGRNGPPTGRQGEGPRLRAAEPASHRGAVGPSNAASGCSGPAVGDREPAPRGCERSKRLSIPRGVPVSSGVTELGRATGGYPMGGCCGAGG